MLKPIILWFLIALSASAQVVLGPGGSGVPTSQIVGQIQTATGGAVGNGTLTFSLSQPAVVSGSATLATQISSCFTSTQGNVVGIPDPLVRPILSTNTVSGTLAAGTYYVEIYYTTAGGLVSAVTPEASIVLSSQGTVIVGSPLFAPSTASGYGVAISATPGTETIQGTSPFGVQFLQNTALVAGATPAAVNNSSCNIYFSDQLVPTGTYYTVNLINKTGSQIAGFPQTWCTYGGAGATINVSQGAPTGNCNVSGVYYPTPIFSNLTSGAAQSINTNLTLTGNLTATAGRNILSAYSLDNIIYVDGVQYATVQSAINAATPPAVVMVPCGTFVGPTTLRSNVSFISACDDPISDAYTSLWGSAPGNVYQALGGTVFTYTGNLVFTQLSNITLRNLVLDFQSNNAGVSIASSSFIHFDNVLIDRCGGTTAAVPCLNLGNVGSGAGNNNLLNTFDHLKINASPNPSAGTVTGIAFNGVNVIGPAVTLNKFTDLNVGGQLAIGVDFIKNCDTNWIFGLIVNSSAAGATGLQFNVANPGSDNDANSEQIIGYSCAAGCSLSTFIKFGQSTGNYVVAQGNAVAPTIAGGTPSFTVLWTGATGSVAPTIYSNSSYRSGDGNVDLTGQTANIAPTTILANSPLGGTYRVSASIIVQSVGTTSTLPAVNVQWTDSSNSATPSFAITATNAGNTTTTVATGSTVISAKAGTAITYSTTGYASTGTPMQYSIHLKLEPL